MATAIGLGMQITANASSMAAGLSDADKAIQKLGSQATNAAKLFDTFAGSTEAAAAAQAAIVTDINLLEQAFRLGITSAEEFRAGMAEIAATAQTQADAFAEGARVTAQVATAEEQRVQKLQRLEQLLQAGAISEQTFARASMEASGANEKAAAADSERADALARAAQITQANLSPQQKYDAEIQDLTGHLNAGRISQETFNSAVQKATQQFKKAESAAKGYDKAADSAGSGNALAFNELSGILSGLPGPIGNVAGRLSGLTSAGQGLSRVFSGGLQGGLGSVSSALTQFLNPATLAVAGISAFGAAASAVANGLMSLQDRVESLGNTAEKLGASFEFVQTLETAAARSGTSIDSLGVAFNRTLKAISEARAGSKEAVDAFARLGISVDDLANATPEEVFRKSADALVQMTDPAERAAAAMTLFGKSGADILPTLRAFGESQRDLSRFSALIDNLDRKRLDDLGNGFEDLQLASQGLGQSLLMPFAGLGEGISKGLANAIGGINAILAPIGDILAPIGDAIGVSLQLFGEWLGVFGRLLGNQLEPLATFGRIASEAIAMLSDQIDFMFGAINDGITVINDFLKFNDVLSSSSKAFAEFGDTAERVAVIIKVAFQRLAEYTVGVVQRFAEFVNLGDTLESLGSVIKTVFGDIARFVGSVADNVGGFVGQLLTQLENLLGIESQAAGVKVPGVDTAEISQAATLFYEQLDKATAKAAEFGQAGFSAVLAYKKSLEDIAVLLQEGTYSQEEADRAAANATATFEASINILEREAEAQRKSADEAKKAADERVKAAERAAEADRRRVESFVDSQKSPEQRDREKAAEDLAAIQREQQRAEEAIAAARAVGDGEALRAAQERLAVLEQVEAKAADIASGEAAARKKAADEAQKAADEAARLDEERQKKISDITTRYLERAMQIEQDRIDALAGVSANALQANDIRTSEGAAQYLALATGREDPAIAEYRKQLKELQKIAGEIGKLGNVVDIVGAA